MVRVIMWDHIIVMMKGQMSTPDLFKLDFMGLQIENNKEQYIN